MGEVMKCFDLAIDKQVQERSVENLYYLGDPCYVVADKEDLMHFPKSGMTTNWNWAYFCQKTFDDKAKKNGEENGMDSIIQWKGQILEIWSNGGDGSWHFDFTGMKAEKIPLNGNKAEFCVDAGIFCIMPVKICDVQDIDELIRLGMVFKHKPELRVEENVVYINDVHDNSVKECWGCDELIQTVDEDWCENGSCVGCWRCFECECEEE